MTSTHADWDVAGYLAGEARGLRKLALRLTRDHADADDLSQDTWVTALSKPLPPPGDRMPWLATIGRNLFLRGHRDRVRRARLLATLDEAAPSAPAQEALERLELLQALAELLQGLPDPYRETVVLRYLEGRSAAAIAAAQGIPAGTVRWRLKQGVDRLRAGLDARFEGDRRRWAVLASFLEAGEGRAPVPWAGSPVQLAVVTALCGVVAAGALLVSRTSAVGPRPASVGAGERVPFAPAGAPLPAFAAGVAAVGQPAAAVEGIVHDGNGRPLSGARVALFPTRETTRATAPDRRQQLIRHAPTGPDGRFRLGDLLPGKFLVAASHDAWAPALTETTIGDTGVRTVKLALAAGGHPLAGVVTDRGGGPVAGALLTAIRRTGLYVGGTRFAAVSDEQGRYALRLPPGPWYLVLLRDGYAAATADVAMGGARPKRHDFQLEPGAAVPAR
jgi:RNA polymerase sigma factor (sigma-70 family)